MMTTKLSKIRRAMYLESGGTRCPFCLSEKLYWQSIEVDIKCATQEVSCEKCGKKWYDYYDLTDIMTKDDGDE